MGPSAFRRTRANALRKNCVEPLEARWLCAAPEFMEGRVVGTVESSAVTAASGIVASRQNMDVLWTFNDSGDSRLFAMNAAGEHLGTYQTGVTARDWEDIAVGPGPQAGVHYLYIADTGDNAEVRSSIVVFRVAEPVVQSSQNPITTTVNGTAAITLAYPDGPHDAETLIVDPSNGDIYIVTKRDARSRIYRAAFPQSTSATTTLTYEGQLTWGQAAGGTISADGDELILKDLDDVFYYLRPAGMSIAEALAQTPQSLPYTNQPLGEGITFDFASSGYFTNSEGTHEELYYYQRMDAHIGDVNGDGAVNRADAASMVRQLGRSCSNGCSGADANADGVVSLTDLALVQMHLGEGAGASPTAADAAVATAAASQRPRGEVATRDNVLRGARHIERDMLFATQADESRRMTATRRPSSPSHSSSGRDFHFLPASLG
jgi:hypothetical protein